MGLLDTVSGTMGAAASVAKGVGSIVKGGASLLNKVSKSLIGKFALGAGAIAILSGKPGDEDSFLGKLGGSFKSFLGSAKDAVASKIAGTALTGVAAVTRAGEGVSEAIEAASPAGTSSVSLSGAVSSDALPATQCDPAAANNPETASRSSTGAEYEEPAGMDGPEPL